MCRSNAPLRCADFPRTRGTSMKHLTTAVVKAATPPALVWDAKVRGLCLRAYGGGTKSFLFSYRVDGRERRLQIGRWPEWSVEAAKDQGKELRRLRDQGRDP